MASLCGGQPTRARSARLATRPLPCSAFNSGQGDLRLVGHDSIDNPDNTTHNLPGHSYYRYSLSEQIYLAEELDASGPISAIELSVSVVADARGDWDIYLGTTSRTSIDNACFLPDNLTLVYSGPSRMELGTTGWVRFDFDEAFPYNGTDNLVLVVYDKSGYYNDYNYYGVHTTAGYQARYLYRDSEPYTLADLTSTAGSPTTLRNDLRLHVLDCAETYSCRPPLARLTAQGERSLSLAWAPGGEEQQWSVDYRVSGAAQWRSHLSATPLRETTLTGLQSGTAYDLRVSAACGDTAFATILPASTLCAPIALPHEEHFEQGLPQCWTWAHPGGGNQPAPAEPDGQGRMASLLADAYAKLPPIDPAEDIASAMLRLRMVGTQPGACLHVGFMPEEGSIDDITLLGTLNIDNIQSNYFQLPFTEWTEEMGRCLVLRARIAGLYIDDLLLAPQPDCPAPDSVRLTAATGTTATIAWTGSADSYIAELGDLRLAPGQGTRLAALGNSLTLTGLAPSTTYSLFLYAVCQGDTSFVSQRFLFQTECAALEVPFFEDFESLVLPQTGYSQMLPPCWQQPWPDFTGWAPGCKPQVYDEAAFAHSGTRSLSLTYDALLTLPALAPDEDPAGLRLSFMMRNNYAQTGVVVGVMEQLVPGSDSAFVPLDTILCRAINEYQPYETYLAAYQGQGRHIALRTYPDNFGYIYIYLDDIRLEQAPACPPAKQFRVRSSQPDEVVVEWQRYQEGALWQLAFGDGQGNILDSTSIAPFAGCHYSLTTLTPGETYYLYVRARCGADAASAWTGPLEVTPGLVRMEANQILVVSACSGIVTDDGGLSGQYSDNQNSYLTLYPSTPFGLVQVEGTYSLESATYDYLRIYDGDGLDGDLLWSHAGSTGTGTVPQCTSTSGPLTLYFHTDGSATYDGFLLNVSCVGTDCPAVANLRAEELGSTDVVLAWDTFAPAQYWQVALTAPGQTPDQALVIPTDHFPISLSGLAPNSRYTVRVRPYCQQADAFGGWCRSITFTTPLCDQLTTDTVRNPNLHNLQSELPIRTGYPYSMSQSIYTAAELQGLATIDGLAFELLSTEEYIEHDVSIYISHTELDNFHQHYELVMADSSWQRLFCGTFRMQTGWNIFPLSQPFQWDGARNILLTVIDSSATNAGSFCRVSSTYTDDIQTMQAFGYTCPPNVHDMSAYPDYDQGFHERPDVVFLSCLGSATCPSPNQLAATEVDNHTATLAWRERGSAQSWLLEWDTATADILSHSLLIEGQPQYTLTGLTPLSQYQWRVRALCGEGDSSAWSAATASFTTAEPSDYYTLSLATGDSLMGLVFGQGTYLELSDVTFSAAPFTGYHFVAWSDGSTANPRTLNLRRDLSLTALFAPNVYTITLSPNNAQMGSVTGGGQYDYHTLVTLEALPAEGYHFTQWSDLSTDNPRQILVEGDRSLIAQFAINMYQVTVTSSDAERGLVAGGGSYSHGSTANLQAVPMQGYHFDSWSDGGQTNPRAVTVTSDTAFHALFSPNSYQIAVASADMNMGTVSGGGTYLYHDTATLTATAHQGYYFTQWNDGTNANPRHLVVTGDQQLIAQFSTRVFTVTAQADDPSMGLVSGGGSFLYMSTTILSASPYTGYRFVAWSDGSTANPRLLTVTQDTTLTALFEVNQYTLTALSNNNAYGIVTGGGTYVSGSVVYLTASANQGYHFTQWNDGSTDNPRLVTVTTDLTYIAQFDPNIYTVSATPNDTLMGTVSGSGQYAYLSLATLEATALPNYHFTAWSDAIATPQRTLTVTGDLALQALFAPDEFTVILLGDSTMGTLLGAGQYPYLATATLEAVPDPCYRFVEWSDGSTENPRTETVTGHLLLTALYEPLVLHSEESASACDRYLWNGQELTESGDYSWQGQSAQGCDSTATLHLTLHYSVESELTVTDTETYLWNGETLTESGDYTWLGQTAQGCDSLVTLHLTLLPPDTTGHESIAAPSAEGFRLWPNPAADFVQIQNAEFKIQTSTVNSQPSTVKIIDLQGRVVREAILDSEFLILDLQGLPAGTYFVKVGTTVKKLIIK